MNYGSLTSHQPDTQAETDGNIILVELRQLNPFANFTQEI